MHSEQLKPQYRNRVNGSKATMNPLADSTIPEGAPSQSSKANVIRLMDVAIESIKATGYQGLIIAGHSLGGAVSTLFYAELLHDYPEIVEKLGDNLKIVTFGSPRAVDLRLADKLDHSPAVHIRFVNDNDVVTSMPPANMQLLYLGVNVFLHQNTMTRDILKLTRKKIALHGLLEYSNHRNHHPVCSIALIGW